MRTDKQVKTRTCDECGKTVSDNGEQSFGGSLWHGWLSITSEYNGRSFEGQCINKQTWDFCCNDCLTKWVIDRSKL